MFVHIRKSQQQAQTTALPAPPPFRAILRMIADACLHRGTGLAAGAHRLTLPTIRPFVLFCSVPGSIPLDVNMPDCSTPHTSSGSLCSTPNVINVHHALTLTCTQPLTMLYTVKPPSKPVLPTWARPSPSAGKFFVGTTELWVGQLSMHEEAGLHTTAMFVEQPNVVTVRLGELPHFCCIE